VGAWKSSFSPKSRGTVVGHCRKCTVGRRRASPSSWISSLVPRRRRRSSCSVPAVVMARDGPGPPERSAGVHTRRSGGHVEVPRPFPSGRRVWSVGVGSIVTGAVPSLFCPVLQVPRGCYSIRDGGMVTGVSGWDAGHIHCGNGGLTPPAHGAVAEWRAFNSFVRRAVGRRRRLSLVLRDSLERGGDESPARG